MIYIFVTNDLKNKDDYLKNCLSLFVCDPVVIREKNKKPFCLEGPFFNLSHSHDLMIIVVSEDGEVGVDIEKRRDNINFELIRRHFFNHDEKKEDFFDVWCRKEAFLKCKGVGVFKNLKNCLESTQGFSFKKIDIAENYTAWICLENTFMPRLKIIRTPERMKKLKKYRS